MPRKSKAKPFWTVDCETDPFKEGRLPVPFIWGLYTGEEYYEFATAAQLVEFLQDKNVTVYAHNGGKFDYHYLRDAINSDEKIMVIAGRMASFKVGDCEFRDSINIIPVALREIQKTEIDYAKLEPDVRHLHMPEIRSYLKSDCVNLYEAIDRYFKTYGRSMTQAGSSFRYWRKHYPTPFVRQTAEQSEFYRKFYYGGRVQCFESGHARADFKVFDINSAYPYAMGFQHPISPGAVITHHLPELEKMGSCMIELDAVAQGCFPLKDEKGAMFFPDDGKVHHFNVTGWELKAALELDAVKIINVQNVYEFPLSVNFNEYVQFFYEQRKEAKKVGDAAGSVFAKLFMNSLYGKFAADPEKYREYLITHPETVDQYLDARLYPNGGVWSDAGPWGDRILMSRPLPESKHKYFNVATAASITGFVRAYLFKALRQSGGLIYCDTDSIACRVPAGMVEGNELGQWKLEMECDEYAVAGKKLYAFHGTDGKWKCASKGTQLKNDPQAIVRIAKGEQVLYKPPVPTYSIHADGPQFTNRVVRRTAKDIRHLS